MPADPTITEHYRDATLRISSKRNFLVAAWFDAPTLPQMKEFGRAGRRLNHKHAGEVGFTNIILRGTPRFDDEVRAEAVSLTREGLFSLGGSHLILVPGLAGAATRAFLSMVMLVGRRSKTVKVFGEVEEASRWIAPQLRSGWSPEEVTTFFEAVRGET